MSVQPAPRRGTSNTYCFVRVISYAMLRSALRGVGGGRRAQEELRLAASEPPAVGATAKLARRWSPTDPRRASEPPTYYYIISCPLVSGTTARRRDADRFNSILISLKLAARFAPRRRCRGSSWSRAHGAITSLCCMKSAADGDPTLVYKVPVIAPRWRLVQSSDKLPEPSNRRLTQVAGVRAPPTLCSTRTVVVILRVRWL